MTERQMTDESLCMSFSTQLRQLRKKEGLTQAAVAKKVGVSRNTYGRWERTGNVSLASLIAIAQALDVLVDLSFHYTGSKRSADSRVCEICSVDSCRARDELLRSGMGVSVYTRDEPPPKDCPLIVEQILAQEEP